MSQNLLEKITIVIFTYNRHELLKQTVKYWLNYNVKLLILDGSESEFIDTCLNSKNIKYINNQKGFYNRLLSSADYIDTEFMILSSDDEFYLPSALISCIEFLSKDLSFSSCGGRTAGFYSDNDKIFGVEEYTNLRNFCLNHENPKERIEYHFKNYTPAHIYSVLRSNKWNKICKYVFEKEFSFYASFELQIEFLVMVSGKSKIIPNLMWMRKVELSPNRNTRPSDSWSLPISKWWYDKEFKKEKELFFHTMRKACEEVTSDQNLKLNEDTIHKLFETYVNKFPKLGKIKKTFKKIIDLIPLKMKKCLKIILFFKSNETIQYKNLLDITSKLELEGVSINHLEFNKVISILQNLNKENKKKF